MKYNKFYIGFAQNGRADNFIIYRPMTNFARVEIRLNKSDDPENELEGKGIDLMDYDKRYGGIELNLRRVTYQNTIILLETW